MLKEFTTVLLNVLHYVQFYVLMTGLCLTTTSSQIWYSVLIRMDILAANKQHSNIKKKTAVSTFWYAFVNLKKNENH